MLRPHVGNKRVLRRKQSTKWTESLRLQPVLKPSSVQKKKVLSSPYRRENVGSVCKTSLACLPWESHSPSSLPTHPQRIINVSEKLKCTVSTVTLLNIACSKTTFQQKTIPLSAPAHALQEGFHFVFDCEMLTLHSGIVIIMCHLFIFLFFFRAMDISGHLGSLSDTFFAPSCCAFPH